MANLPRSSKRRIRQTRSRSQGGNGRVFWVGSALVVVAIAVVIAAYMPRKSAEPDSCIIKVLDANGVDLGEINSSNVSTSGRFKYYDNQGIIATADTACASHNQILYRYMSEEGRHFLWPAHRIGEIVEVQKIDAPFTDKPVTLEVLSSQPKVFLLKNFFSSEEAEYLIARATDPRNPYRLRNSTTGVEDWNNGGVDSFSRTRTSENAFDIDSPVAKRIFKRAHELLRMKFDMCQADGLQIVRYSPRQAYNNHYDYFHVGEATQQGEFNFDPKRGGSNRFATIFLYLSDVELGGQTIFPLADEVSRPVDATIPEQIETLFPSDSWQYKMAKDCYKKFSVEPTQLSAVLFYNQDSNGNLDSRSLHGGCPVISGTKWAANLWVWNSCRYGM
mmetsp:Transcript_9591/g.15536  ORF Transcript_9591/g.15536 Transcript_9591/m.15536 type:complete len:389 (-) Transcript_9591:127-1293(-)